MVNLYKSKLQAPLHIFCNFKATMAMFWGKMITIVQITTDPTGPCCTKDGVKYFLSVAVGKAAFLQLVSSEGCTVVVEKPQLCRKQCTKYYNHKDSHKEHHLSIPSYPRDISHHQLSRSPQCPLVKYPETAFYCPIFFSNLNLVFTELIKNIYLSYNMHCTL